MNRRLWIFLIGVIIGTGAYGQRTDNIKIEIEGEKVKFSYDLLDTSDQFTYSVKFYCIINDYAHVSYHATGDVGKSVTGGKDKLIIWDHSKELSGYSLSEMDFEVKLLARHIKKKEVSSIQ